MRFSKNAVQNDSNPRTQNEYYVKGYGSWDDVAIFDWGEFGRARDIRDD
jgi:acyl transferase domain-containing protein